ncbi:MAG: OsmC family protein, partial [Bacteroidota bacterium]
MKEHAYKATTTWTGNKGPGTLDYKSYERSHTLSVAGKPDLLGSSDPLFRGDKTKHNPEDLLVSALSGCHMLWYLHLCAVNNVVVVDYVDHAEGIMVEHEDGSGEFTRVTLKPRVTVKDASMIEKANQLHKDAHRYCFIARSVNFDVLHEPVATAENVIA